MRDAVFLIEISRGVFRLEEVELTFYLDLIAVYRRCPHGTICLNSALSFWDLTDEVPAEVHLAVPRRSWTPHISYPPTKVHVFNARTFDQGRGQVDVGSEEKGGDLFASCKRLINLTARAQGPGGGRKGRKPRRNKRFCNDACRQRHHQEKQEKL